MAKSKYNLFRHLVIPAMAVFSAMACSDTGLTVNGKTGEMETVFNIFTGAENIIGETEAGKIPTPQDFLRSCNCMEPDGTYLTRRHISPAYSVTKTGFIPFIPVKTSTTHSQDQTES